MRKYVLLFFVLLPCLLFAQQAPQYSMYFLNPYSFNPAYSGLDESLSITGVFRKQWVQLQGSPINQSLNAHMPWYYMKGGVGLQVENDMLGAERNLSASLSYAYHRNLGNDYTLSLGLAGGMIQKTIDGDKLRAPDGNYENIIDHQDDFLPIGKEGAIAPLLNVGLYLKNESLEIGLSANNIIEPFAEYNLNAITQFQFLRNYFIIFAYEIELGSRFQMKPSLFLKTDFIEFQTDISSIFTYNDNIFAGASLRGYSKNTFDAVVLTAGMRITENITLAYAYDVSISSLRTYNKGSHEVLLNYNLRKQFGGEKPVKIIFNPRTK